MNRARPRVGPQHRLRRCPIAPDLAAPQDVNESFHAVMGQLDMPMHIVTAVSATGERNGCLLGFASQCAIHPPRYQVWLSKNNRTFAVAQDAEALGVHFLDPGHIDLAIRFGTRTGDEVDKLADETWHPGPLGVPILDEVDRWFVGRILDRTEVGDHMGYLLEPVEASTSSHAVGQLGFQSVKHLDAGHDAAEDGDDAD